MFLLYLHIMTHYPLHLHLSITVFQGDYTNLDIMLITFKNELNSLVWAAYMPSWLGKTWKLWGHMSHGHSQIDKYWKHPRGWGNAGGIHHHRINVGKYHSGYFGEVGMRHYHLKRNQNFCPAVNLDKLWTLVSEQTRVNAAKNKNEAALIIDVVWSGYHKVLRKGKLSKWPVIMKAKFSVEELRRFMVFVCVGLKPHGGVLLNTNKYFSKK